MKIPILRMKRCWILCGVACASFLVGQQKSASPHLDTPAYKVVEGAGNYTGFNSLNLQEIYVVRKQAAVRTQIARGWGKPIVTRLSTGELLASQYKNLRGHPNPAYPDAVEEAAISHSVDNGLSWSAPRLLGIPGRVTQFTALKNDVLILAAGNRLYRSTDRAGSWSLSSQNWQPRSEDGHVRNLQFDETNGVTELLGGTILCGAYISLGPGQTRSYLLRSTDDGRTWGDGSFVTAASEISYVVMPSGRLLGFARTATGGAGEGGAMLMMVESSDSGRTWTTGRTFGLGQAQVPGFPLLLIDRRLILVYGNRQFPFGAQAIASRDEGRTWSIDEPILLSWFSWDSYCGHPRSLLLPGGEVLTGYYSRIFKDGSPNEDIVSHAVKWRVPDHWPLTASNR